MAGPNRRPALGRWNGTSLASNWLVVRLVVVGIGFLYVVAAPDWQRDEQLAKLSPLPTIPSRSAAHLHDFANRATREAFQRAASWLFREVGCQTGERANFSLAKREKEAPVDGAQSASFDAQLLFIAIVRAREHSLRSMASQRTNTQVVDFIVCRCVDSSSLVRAIR